MSTLTLITAKEKKPISLDLEKHENFFGGGEKMRNASDQQGENERQ